MPLLTQAMDQTTASGSVADQALCRLSLRRGLCRLAGRRGGLALASQALDLARQHKERGDEAHALHQLGEIAGRRDPPDVEQAETHYRQALALAEALGMRPLQAHCHLGLGTLYAKIGQPEQARAELSAAITLYRAMDMTFWLPRAEGALAQVVGAGGQ